VPRTCGVARARVPFALVAAGTTDTLAAARIAPDVVIVAVEVVADDRDRAGGVGALP